VGDVRVLVMRRCAVRGLFAGRCSCVRVRFNGGALVVPVVLVTFVGGPGFSGLFAKSLAGVLLSTGARRTVVMVVLAHVEPPSTGERGRGSDPHSELSSRSCLGVLTVDLLMSWSLRALALRVVVGTG
jgi:hypothetical protein